MTTRFWKDVEELAALREQIPANRRVVGRGVELPAVPSSTPRETPKIAHGHTVDGSTDGTASDPSSPGTR